MVDRRYARLATPARSSLPRSAATPAFVCVRISTGLAPIYRASVPAISSVFPQPAGEVTVPRSTVKRSMSVTRSRRPPEYAFDDCAEPRIGLGQVGTDDFARCVL